MDELPPALEALAYLIPILLGIAGVVELLRRVIRATIIIVTRQQFDDIRTHLDKQDDKLKLIENDAKQHQTRIHKRVDELQKAITKRSYNNG